MSREWPPSEDKFQSLAMSALNKSDKKDVKVLVYWKNDPNLMIFDPFHYASTDYVERKYKNKDRSVHVIIGKED
tara:strand:- start:145 stop:366 length:222 start_codon:yes stop_codon:yes gene_type:complete